MRNLLIPGVLFITIGASWWLWQQQGQNIWTVTAPATPIPTPLTKYSFDALKARPYQTSPIKLERVIKEQSTYTSYLFSFTSDGKKVTGQANLPKKPGKLPVVMMVRGYADKEIYFTGLSTRKAAGIFAQNGFITLAPDFLGFGGSDQASVDILEVRFEKPITVLNLLESIKTLPQADINNVFLWGHSNGGQITISVLEISGQPFPTSLWAPVTRPFPQSVVDFVGELDDQGKMVIASISAFLKLYQPEQFSTPPFVGHIQAPIQIHQGMGDQLVQPKWTKTFVDLLQKNGKTATYYTYPGDDHNLSRNWDTVVARDITFFKKHLK